MAKPKYTPLVLLLLLLFFLADSKTRSSWEKKGTQVPISWDGFGYYFYLPTFFYDDFKLFRQYDYIQTKYSPTGGGTLSVKKAPNGNLIMRYPIGAAFLYFPGFAAGHLYAQLSGYPVDGFSMPYQWAMSIWTTLFGMLGLWVLSKILLRYYSDKITAFSILILGIASNVFFYISFTQLHTHIYLFTVYAVLIWLTDTLYQREKFNYILIGCIGMLCGLLVICRPTEIISCFIPLLWGVADWNSFKQRIDRFVSEWKAPMFFVLMLMLGVSPLLVYWKVYSGQWFFYSYEDDQTFSFGNPHIINFLFSYRKGWFTYTPVMYTAMFGFYWLWRNHRKIFIPVFVFFVFNLYLISSWDCWWYGGSFSQRAIIQSYPLLMFPFAEFVLYVSKNRIRTIVFTGFIFFCTWLNLLMTYQAVFTDVMESDSMTKAYFWRIFGKTSLGPYDKKLLDTDEEMPSSFQTHLQMIYQTSYEDSIGNNETFACSGKKSVQLGRDMQCAGRITIPIGIKNPSWIRAKAMVYFPYMEWNTWKWAQFTVVLKSKTGEEKYRSIRSQRGVKEGKWSEIFVDIKNENNKKYDSVSVYYWNANSTGNIYFDNLKVFVASETN